MQRMKWTQKKEHKTEWHSSERSRDNSCSLNTHTQTLWDVRMNIQSDLYVTKLPLNYDWGELV